MNGAYESFRIDDRGKTDVDSYIALVINPKNEDEECLGGL